MGIINTFSTLKKERPIQAGKSAINNRKRGPQICPNRKELFKKFNYRFQNLHFKSVAS